MKYALTAIACACLAACGGGDTYTTTVNEAPTVADVQPATTTVGPAIAPLAPAGAPTPPPVATCAKPDPQPTHGHDPACHTS